MRLTASLLPPEEAREITWGGKKTCEDCKFQKRNFEAFHNEDLGDACFFSRGACAYPPPAIKPSMAGFWDVWRDAPRRLVTGWDGTPLSLDMRQVEVIAKAHREPLDPLFVRWWSVAETFWTLQEIRNRPKTK